jgi:hypothetical protein
MQCPPGYRCSENSYSSVWLCTSAGNCDSYGLVGDGMEVTPSVSGMAVMQLNVVHRHPNGNLLTNLTLKCNPVFEGDHFQWLEAASVANGQLQLTALTSAACTVESPTPLPVPPGEMCDMAFHEKVLDLLEYTRAEGGWQASVSITGDGSGVAELYYQPCAGIACPEGMRCEGDDQGTVWLCQNGDCVGYGLFENNVSGVGVDEVEPYIVVHYSGDRHREAAVSYKYDSGTKQGELRMPGEVRVEGTVLYFDVGMWPSRKSVSGGAVFLIIVEAIAVVYIAFGVLYGLGIGGRIGLPNPAFWEEVWLSLRIGVLTIIPCLPKKNETEVHEYRTL